MPRIHMLPNLKKIRVPDNASDEEIMAWATKQGLIEEVEEESDSGLFARNIWEPAAATAMTAPSLAMAGAKQLTAGVFNDDELLRSAIKDQTEVSEWRSDIHTSPSSAMQAVEYAKKGNIFEAAKEIGSVFTQAAAGSAPEMVIPAVLAATGHPILAAAALFAQHVLHNANRQAGLMDPEAATVEDQNIAGNLLASGVNTGLDALTFKMLRLEKLIPAIKSGRISKGDLAQEAGDIKKLAQQLDDQMGKTLSTAEDDLAKRIGDKFAQGIGWDDTAHPAFAASARVGGTSAWEGLVEGVQAVTERAAAGQSIGDTEAFEEYFENFAGGLGAGAVFGAGAEGIRHLEYSADLRRAEIMDKRNQELAGKIRNVDEHKKNVEIRMEEAKATALLQDVAKIEMDADKPPTNEELLDMASDLNIKTGSQTAVGVDVGWMSFLKRTTGKMHLDDKNMTDADRWNVFQKLKSMAVQNDQRSFAVNTKEEISGIAKKILKNRKENKNDTPITREQVAKMLNLDKDSLLRNDINDTYAAKKVDEVMADLARFGYARQSADGDLLSNFHHYDAKGNKYYGLMDGSDNEQYLNILEATIANGRPPTMKELGMRSAERYRSFIDRMIADGQIYEYSKNKFATTNKSDGTQGKAYGEEFIPGKVKTFTVRDALGRVVRTANSQDEANRHANELSEADAPWDVWVGGKRQRYKTKSAATNAANKINNRTPWTVRIGKRHVDRFENKNQADIARVNEINRITNIVRKNIESNMTPQQVRSAGALINSTLRDMGPRIADSVKVKKTKARTKMYVADAKKHYGSKRREAVNRVRHKRTDDAGSVLDVKDEFFDSFDQAEENARGRSENIISDTIDTIVEGRQEVTTDKWQRANLALGRAENRRRLLKDDGTPKVLRDIIDKIKSKYGVDINVLFKTFREEDSNIGGGYSHLNREIYLNKTILDMYDLDNADSMENLFSALEKILSHEFIHALRDSGAITKRQWAILLKEAKQRDASAHRGKPDGHKGKYTFYDIARKDPTYEERYNRNNFSDKEKALAYEEEAVSYLVDAMIADQLSKGTKERAGPDAPSGILNSIGRRLKAIVSFFKKGGYETPDSLVEGYMSGSLGRQGVVNTNVLQDTARARSRAKNALEDVLPQIEKMERENSIDLILNLKEAEYVKNRDKDYNFNYDEASIESDTEDIKATTSYSTMEDMLEAVDNHYGDTNPVSDHPINIVSPDTVDSVIYIDGKPVAVRMKHDGNELVVNRIMVGENYGETLPEEVGGGIQPVGRGAKLDEIAHVLHYDGITSFSTIGSESTYDNTDRARRIANEIVPVKPNVWKAFDSALNIENISSSIRNWGETKLVLKNNIADWAHKKEIEFFDRRAHATVVDERMGNDPYATTSAYSALLNADDALSFLNASNKYGTMTVHKDGHSSVEPMPLENLDGVGNVFDGKSYGVDERLFPDKHPGEDNPQVGGYEIIITPLLNDINGHPRRTADGKSDDLIQIWHAYRAALRGKRLSDDGKMVPMTKQQIEDGIDFGEKFPVLKVVNHNFNKWNNGNVKFLIDSGVVTKEKAKMWTEHGDWIPFYVDLEGATPENEQARALLGQLRRVDEKNEHGQKMFNKIAENNPFEAPYHGHDLEIQDPMIATLMNAQAAIKAGLYNIAAQRIAKNEIAAKTAEDITFLKDDDGNILTDKEGKPQRTPEGLRRDSITIRVNGENRYIRFEDDLTFQMMLGTQDEANPVPDWLQKPSRVYRSMVTRWPAFALRNVSRDSLATWGLTGADMKPIIHSFDQFRKDLAHHIKTGKYPEGHRRLERMGAAGGGYEHQGLDAGARGMVKNILKNKSHLPKGLLPPGSHKDQTIFEKGMDAWDRMGEWSALSETATRQIVYEYVLKKTNDPGRAATAAREVLNFSRRGSNRFARLALPLYPFLNSRFQGQRLIYKQGVRGKYSPVPKFDREGKELDKDVVRMGMIMPQSRSSMYKRALYFTGGMMLYGAAAGEEDWYKYGITEHARDNSLPVPLGDGRVVLLPLIPWELGTAFGVWPLQLVHAALGRQSFTDAKDKILRSAVGQMEVNPIPQPIRGPIEAITNHSFLTGRDIVTKGQLGSEAYGADTDRTSVLLGKITGVSPEKITHIFKSYFGTIGSAVLFTLDAIQRNPGMKDVTGATSTPLEVVSWDNLATMPMFKSFMQSGMAKRGSTEQLAFADLAKASDELGTRIRRARRQHPGDVKDFVNDEDLWKARHKIAKIKAALYKLNQREEEVKLNMSLSRAAKHDMLRRLSKSRINVLRSFEKLKKAMG